MGNVNIKGKLQFLITKYHHIEYCGGEKMKIGSKKTLLTVTIMVANFLPHLYKFHFENGIPAKPYLNKDFFSNPIHLRGK